MDAEGSQKREEAPLAGKRRPTTYVEVMEEKFADDLREAIRAWRVAGKPRKR